MIIAITIEKINYNYYLLATTLIIIKLLNSNYLFQSVVNSK